MSTEREFVELKKANELFKENLDRYMYDNSALKSNVDTLRHQITLYEISLACKLFSKPNTCSFPLCEGKGNTNGKNSNHTSLKNCPNKQKNPLIEAYIQLVMNFKINQFKYFDILNFIFHTLENRPS